MGKQVKNGGEQEVETKIRGLLPCRGLVPHPTDPLHSKRWEVSRKPEVLPPVPPTPHSSPHTPGLAAALDRSYPRSRRFCPERGSAEDAFPEAFSGTPPSQTSAKVERPEKLGEEAWQFCYLVGTLETGMAATGTALLPKKARLNATDIETAAILLQANTRTDHRKGQTSFVSS